VSVRSAQANAAGPSRQVPWGHSQVAHEVLGWCCLEDNRSNDDELLRWREHAIGARDRQRDLEGCHENVRRLQDKLAFRVGAEEAREDLDGLLADLDAHDLTAAAAHRLRGILGRWDAIREHRA
jgi:hypothetical protein